jgi:uncharacterized repeat protein (TIGR04076 family)
MKRRDFCGKAGCAAAGLVAAPMVMGLSAQEEQKEEQKEEKKKRRRYKIEVEIYEARKDTWCHKKGDKFQIPEDMGKICPWLLASMWDFIRLLQNGVTLGWKYEGTPYEKVIDPDGITTEYVRCPDPTANLVAKIIRTAEYV